MNKTAIQLLKESIDLEIKSGTKMVVNWDMYLAMEKEQIETAWHDGYLLGRNGWVQEHYSTGTQYYNETYGGNK